LDQVIDNFLSLFGRNSLGNNLLVFVEYKQLRIALKVIRYPELIAIGTPAIGPVVQNMLIYKIDPLLFAFNGIKHMHRDNLNCFVF
jgi:hypothetical protein